MKESPIIHNKMRQIKFRGKRPNSAKWITGSLVQLFGFSYILNDEHKTSDCSTEVITETVGQFTGLTDKDGKEIYEGDIIEDKNGIGVIMWFQTAWGVASYAYGYDGLKSYTAVDSFYSKETKEWSVIGNIYDNPELLK